MKTALGFLSEEGRRRSKNAARRIRRSAGAMFLVAGAGGYGIHRYWVSPGLTPLQRVYFKQYLKSSSRSYLPNTESRYTTLSAILTDPHGKEQKGAATNLMLDPVLTHTHRLFF